MQRRTQPLLHFMSRCWNSYRWLSLGALCVLLAGFSGTLYVVMARPTSRSPIPSAHSPVSSTAAPTAKITASPTKPSGIAIGPVPATPITPRPTPTSTPTPPPGSVLVYDDEFNGSSLSPTWVAWNRPGDDSNGESECYIPADVAVGGGNLALTAKVDSSCANYAYTAGGIQWGTKSFTYGTIEYRAKFAGGTGTWPAIWLLGANCQADEISDAGNNCNWPNPGSEEIDITEVFSGSATTPKQNLITNGGIQTCMPPTSDVSQNWHTYDLVWQPGSLVWKIDGTVTCTFTTNVPSTPMFPIMNVALGGNGGGTIDDSTLPQTMYVDYLRIYQ